MDLGNIIYIVAIVAYFIYQATRKKGSQDLPEEETGQAPPQKGMSFEDLLKEIRQAQNPTATEKPALPKPEPFRPISVPQARTLVARNPVLIEEEEEEDDDDEVRRYEGAFGAKNRNPYQEYRELDSILSTPLKKIDYDSLSSKKVNPYAELLKNPKSLKQAVVLSEILKPKYF